MSSPNAARLRIIRRLAAGLDPSDADIDEFHEGEIGLFDEPDEIASGTSDVSRNEQPSLIHVSQASTWYKRVGLGNYLRNTPVVPFLNLVKEPVESGGDIEAAAQAIWNALAGVVRVGEQVIAHSGRFVREKAAQIHLDQKPRRPLEALRDADELRLWAEPWQRVLMFFVRTQTSDNWQSHWYRFTIRQQSSWDGLWQAAHKYQGMEEDTSTFQMNPLQRACLGFCVELLGQSYQTSAFECPLVCAWAALGYDEEGWLPLSTYVDVKLATAEKQVLDELVKLLQSRDLRGENGNWKEFLHVYDKNADSPSDPSRRSHEDLVQFLTTFKKKEDLQLLKCHANHLLIENLKQESQDEDTPEQMLVRLTVEHPSYSLDYSFKPYSEDWFVSDVGMKMKKVMESTNMVAVDCEMVLCEDGTEGLVRVGVVDRDLKVILDEFVKPNKPVVDYRTDITGITAEDIENASLSVVDIQETLQPFLSTGTILVGHSLNRDLEVLKIDHPKVIDTALVFKYPNTRKLRRPSLNNLCKSILGYEVRKTGVPHDCVHDASAAMKLALAVVEKRVDTTIKPSKEMLEVEKAKLFLHKIPNNVPSEELEQVLSGKFTLDVKQAKTQGRYYCAFALFHSSEDADQAFEHIDGIEMTDSLGLPQKVVIIKLSSGSRASIYVRKMVQDE